ncbi:flagellar assembly protein FliW [Dendrosporobacter sp. 1207_IL3150]|uniref:flagellar assembly protein FliW n=1 Tax=Dendrosporobacter sp. 1207_IL3150 TaxID=3084054 RepID=UPI002FDA04B6
MIIESTRLGQLEVNKEQIISFPSGIPGFPNEKEFILIHSDIESPFAFLQSISEPNLTFIVVEPFQFFKDYEFSLDDQVVESLKLSGDNPPRVLNIVTVPEKAEEMTANLLAPVIINPNERLAQQIVLEKVSFSTKHRLFPEGLPETETKGGA